MLHSSVVARLAYLLDWIADHIGDVYLAAMTGFVLAAVALELYVAV